MLRFVLCLLLLQSASWAQDNDILGYEIENANTMENPAPAKKVAPSAKKKNSIERERERDVEPVVLAPLPTKQDPAAAAVNVPKPVPATGNLKMEDFYQTWNARKVRQGIGYSPQLGVAEYDRWLSAKWGFLVGVRYSKNQDSFTETRTTAYNPTGLTLTDSTTFGGIRNPTVLVVVLGAKNRIWQNDWLQINWGPLLSYTQGTSVTYNVGTTSRTVPNVNTPNDYSVTDSGIGKVTTGVDPTYALGVRLGSEIYVKWFPNLSLCADIVMFNQLPIKGTTETNTSSRTYNVVSGVPQASTTETYNTNRVYNDFGGSASTGQTGAAFFNIFGANWSIKYVW